MLPKTRLGLEILIHQRNGLSGLIGFLQTSVPGVGDV